MIDHLLSNIVLKLAILNAAGIADDMKGHVLGNVFGDVGKIFGEVIVIRSQIQWSRQRLKAGVAIADRVQWADTGMGLRVLSLGTRAHVTGVQGRFRSLDSPGRMFHGASLMFCREIALAGIFWEKPMQPKVCLISNLAASRSVARPRARPLNATHTM
jgi:hypothetical protein